MILRISEKALASKELSPQLKLVLGIFSDRKTVTCNDIRRALPVSRSTGFELAKAFNELAPIYRTPNSKNQMASSRHSVLEVKWTNFLDQ